MSILFITLFNSNFKSFRYLKGCRFGKAYYKFYNMPNTFLNVTDSTLQFIYSMAATWCRRIDAVLLPLGSRVRISVTPCAFRGGRNGDWVGFSRSFSRFSLPQILFHRLSILISFHSFHFISSTPVLVHQAILLFTDLQSI